MTSLHISRHHAQYTWNRDYPPVIEVESGDTVTIEVANASGGQLTKNSTVADVNALDFSRVNPVTGPIAVTGAEPGDALIVEVVAVELDDWGWTANIPGFGLLADKFPSPHLRISHVTSRYAEILPGLQVPVVPFLGTIGLAPSSTGDHPLVPPSAQGGNMDIRHVTPGARLWLPVAVPGALLSIGDTHAAQGDGEVAGTAIETSSLVTVRILLKKGVYLRFPRLETHPVAQRAGGAWATTGIAPDLMEASRHATLDMVDLITEITGLDPIDAYLLASVAGDLKISEVVDVPNWVVSMHIEKDILDGTA